MVPFEWNIFQRADEDIGPYASLQPGPTGGFGTHPYGTVLHPNYAISVGRDDLGPPWPYKKNMPIRTG